MSAEIFLFIYILFLFSFESMIGYVIIHDKRRCIRQSCIGLTAVLSRFAYNKCINQELVLKTVDEIEEFYDRFSRKRPDFKKTYPNIIMWIDAIILRMELGYEFALNLLYFEVLIKDSRDMLIKKYPFSKCEKYQQDILKDIQTLGNCDNLPIIQNILQRTEEEFLRLSSDIKKNKRGNTISIIIGIVGIITSILMALVKI